MLNFSGLNLFLICISLILFLNVSQSVGQVLYTYCDMACAQLSSVIMSQRGIGLTYIHTFSLQGQKRSHQVDCSMQQTEGLNYFPISQLEEDQ